MFRDDRGKVTIFFTIIAVGWVGMLGLVVVGGGRIRAYQRADNVAAEAARAAGSAIDAASAVPGGAKLIDTAKATNAALTYLSAAGATGTVTVSADRLHVTVTAVISYTNPSGLEFIGGATWQATGTASVTLLIG